jgi:hypothetical protein
MRRFAAEVIFSNPDDVPNARRVLAEADCELNIDYDAIDTESAYQWGMITGTTGLTEDEIRFWLGDLVRNAGAISPGHFMDLVEWGYGDPWLPSER